MDCYTLYSGSSGNCIFLREGKTEILIDAGVSLKRIDTALHMLGTCVSNIKAVYITHEHSDHTAGLGMMAKNFHIPIFAPLACAKEIYLSRLQGGKEAEACALAACIRTIAPDLTYETGGIEITPFSTPHDSVDSVGYLVGDKKIGIATDLGHVSEQVRMALLGCKAVIVESNYDKDMLFSGPYPPYLKERVASESGHLNNLDCAEFVTALAEGGTKDFTLFHLSKENNTPEIALSASREALASRGAEKGEVALRCAARSEVTKVL